MGFLVFSSSLNAHGIENLPVLALWGSEILSQDLLCQSLASHSCDISETRVPQCVVGTSTVLKSTFRELKKLTIQIQKSRT